MHPNNVLNAQLQQLASGRVFCRTNGGTGFIGLVEMPAYVGTECLREFRLNSHIWMDAQRSRVATSRYGHDQDQPSYLSEHAANDLLRDLSFGQSILPDGLECFVRKSFFPHEDPTMSWNIIVSAKKEPLRCMPKDGLYEFKDGACTLINDNIYAGSNMGQQFSQPLWGPGGQYALSSTMEMQAYTKWIGAEREKNMKRDPMFKEFAQAMAALGEMPMYMTGAEVDSREKASKRIIHQLLDEDDSPSP